MMMRTREEIEERLKAKIHALKFAKNDLSTCLYLNAKIKELKWVIGEEK